jgi:hypothetical protein
MMLRLMDSIYFGKLSARKIHDVESIHFVEPFNPNNVSQSEFFSRYVLNDDLRHHHHGTAELNVVNKVTNVVHIFDLHYLESSPWILASLSSLCRC